MSWQASTPRVPLEARTATGQSPAFTNGGSTDVTRLARLKVTAASGTTPTLNVKLQKSSNNGGTWADDTGQTFAQLTAAGSEVKVLTLAEDLYRYVWTIAGTTPSFTFSIEDADGSF